MGLLPWVTMVVVVAATMAGCGRSQPRVTTLKVEDVPTELMQVARKKLPGVTFDTAWRKASGTYEIRGKAANGKIREIDLRADGTVEEIE